MLHKPESKQPKKESSSKFKYKLVKAIDVAGLNFLTPVVRLCYGEEPKKQLKQIVQFIVIPSITVAIAIAGWFVVAEKIQTKSGKLPNPSETLAAAHSIQQFHFREQDKMRAFNLGGKARQDELATVETRLAELETIEAAANESVVSAKSEASEALQAKLAPLEEKYAGLSAKYKTLQAERTEALKATASEIAMDDIGAKDAYVKDVRGHRDLMDQEKETLRSMKAEIGRNRNVKDSTVAKALAYQTEVAEERQYLGKMRDQLTSANRGEKISAAVAKLEEQKQQLMAAEPEAMFAIANKVAKSENRIRTLEESSYADPKTLPYQIKRSVLCVFTGFLLGSAIAIPIGILCGLSKTFMAAVTPFIAIFKPVSPIVWLPVALIVVGGFIPDPDKHWLTQWMWSLPVLGKYQINPAFIASAVTVALCSLWATMTNTALGVASVDKDHMNVARVLQLGFWDRLFKIVLPSALPLVFAGLRISLGIGWMVLIAAELLATSEGIGKFVWDQFNNGNSDSFAKMVVVVFVVGAIGLLLDRIMIVLQRLVSFDGAPSAV